jgi:hypothetical protein
MNTSCVTLHALSRVEERLLDFTQSVCSRARLETAPTFGHVWKLPLHFVGVIAGAAEGAKKTCNVPPASPL